MSIFFAVQLSEAPQPALWRKIWHSSGKPWARQLRCRGRLKPWGIWHENMGETLGEWKVNFKVFLGVLKLIQLMTYPQMSCCVGGFTCSPGGWETSSPKCCWCCWISQRPQPNSSCLGSFPSCYSAWVYSKCTHGTSWSDHHVWGPSLIKFLFPSHKTEQPKVCFDLHICSVSTGWSSRDWFVPCSWSSWSSFWINGFVWK